MAMRNIHLALEGEESDLYSGYEYSDPVMDELEDDPDFQRIVRTRYGNRPPLVTSGPPGTGMKQVPGTSLGLRTQVGRPTTGVAPESGQARPMTGVTAAGFSSVLKGQHFDPLKQSVGVGVAASAEKPKESPEEVIKILEKSVNTLIQESAEASVMGELTVALDKAKEAGRKERMLCKQREQANMTDQINLDLTYCVLFNLANQYQVNRMHTEALNTYLLIVRNRMFSNGGRLRVNMGNIYVEQRKYPQAIKMYRMALDQIQDTHKTARLKILQNIGIVFVKMGQYTDAINSFEHIMSEKPDFTTGLNLILCYYAIGDREKVKKCFQRMLQIATGIEDEDRYFPTVEDDPHQRLLIEAIKDDSLRDTEKKGKEVAERAILTAAKLIAPVIQASFADGFDWCTECLRTSPYSELASELEIAKALTYLRERDVPRAIETFKFCGKKDGKMAGAAATNLSFILLLEGDYGQAEKYADAAMAADRYNPHALVNKGNCVFSQGHYKNAKEFYQEALSVEATCTEALYNMGLVYKRMGSYQEAVDTFHKLQSILRDSAQVIYQLADLYDKLDDFTISTEWFMQLISLVPTDPGMLQRLGEMFDAESDHSQAFQYYYESFRYFPTNIDVISWLGAHYMDSQFADKAIHYFERASLIQPNEINWQLMVASCHRKTGNYHRALQCYKEIHKRFPENTDCLKFLVRLCTDLGLKEVQEYSLKLRKAEKAREAKRQRELSSGSRKSSGSSNGSAGRGHGSISGSRSSATIPPKDRILSGGSDGDSSRGSVNRKKEVDAVYKDPLGELPQRPRTAARAKPLEDDEFLGAELTDLLPE